MPIQQKYRGRGASQSDILETINREMIPIGAAVREVVNRMLQTPLEDEAETAATVRVNWRIKRHALITLIAPLTEVFFADPEDAGYYYLEIDQSGGGNTIGAWPANVRWLGAVVPTVTATNGRIDLFEFYWNGSVYLGTARQDFG